MGTGCGLPYESRRPWGTGTCRDLAHLHLLVHLHWLVQRCGHWHRPWVTLPLQRVTQTWMETVGHGHAAHVDLESDHVDYGICDHCHRRPCPCPLHREHLRRRHHHASPLAPSPQTWIE